MAVYVWHPPDPAVRAARLAEEHRGHVRRARRRLAWRCLGCLGSATAGLALIGAGFHASDPGYGAIGFWGGLAVGNGGILATLLVSYRQAIEAGDL